MAGPLNGSPSLACHPAILLFALLAAACSEEIGPDDDGLPVTSCDERRGRDHAGRIDTETWRRADSPHHLRADIQLFGVLTVEPGALICGSPGVKLAVQYTVVNATSVQAGRLLARGTPELPIVFTAEDPSAPWYGIRIEGFGGNQNPSQIRHALVQYALWGVTAGSPIDIDSTRFRQIENTAVGLSYAGGRLLRSVIDTAAIRGGQAVSMAGGIFEENVIRGSGGDGLKLDRMGTIQLLGGRIEGSAGVGVMSDASRPPHVTETRLLRISGGRSYSARMPLALFQKLWPTPAEQDSVLGNADERVELYGDTYGGANLNSGELTLSTKLRWFIGNGLSSSGYAIIGESALLRLPPGTRLAGRVLVNGRLIAEGTAESPIQIGGLRLVGPRNDSTRLTHVHFKSAYSHLHTEGNRKVILDHVQLGDSAALVIRSAGSRISNSVIDAASRSFDRYPTGVIFGAPGILVERTIFRNARGEGVLIESGDVTMRDCEVSGSTSDGLRVTGGTLRINGCNIERNSGFGVNNLTATQVDARGNWWGDPAGPFGPNGDGVSGNVDYSGFAPAPFTVTTANPAAARVRSLVSRRAVPATVRPPSP